MRFGYRKKFGNFYVSNSISSKEVGQGCLSIIILPFYFLFIVTYYFVFWPFIAIYRLFAKKNKPSTSAHVTTLKPVPLRAWYLLFAICCVLGGVSQITEDVFISLIEICIGGLMLAFSFLAWRSCQSTQSFSNLSPSKPQQEPQQPPLSQPSYSQFQIERELQIFNDSIKLIVETKNPQTFFERYSEALRSAEALAAMTSQNLMQGEPPQNAVEMLHRQQTEITNNFLDRYAKEIRLKAFELTRERKAKVETFQLITSEFDDQMTAESQAYRDKLYAKMLEKIQSIES